MEKRAIIEKMKTIKPTAFPVYVTTDMGLEFDVMSSDGAYTHLGKIVTWPLWIFKKLDDDLLERLENTENNVSIEDFQNTDLYYFLLKLSKRRDFNLKKIVEEVIQFHQYCFPDKYIYIYCDPDHIDFHFDLFNSSEEIEKKFIEDYFCELGAWEEMDEDWLNHYYEAFSNHGEGIGYYNVNNIDENEVSIPLKKSDMDL